MDIYRFIPLISALMTSALGLYVLYRNPRGRANRLYCGLAGALSVWSLGEFVMKSSGTASIAEAGAKLGGLGWLPGAPPCIVHFVLVLTGRDGFLRSAFRYALLTSRRCSSSSCWLSPIWSSRSTLASTWATARQTVRSEYLRYCTMLAYFIIGMANPGRLDAQVDHRGTRGSRLAYVLVATLVPFDVRHGCPTSYCPRPAGSCRSAHASRSP